MCLSDREEFQHPGELPELLLSVIKRDEIDAVLSENWSPNNQKLKKLKSFSKITLTKQSLCYSLRGINNYKQGQPNNVHIQSKHTQVESSPNI